jgi:hypothetical protein
MPASAANASTHPIMSIYEVLNESRTMTVYINETMKWSPSRGRILSIRKRQACMEGTVPSTTVEFGELFTNPPKNTTSHKAIE